MKGEIELKDVVFGYKQKKRCSGGISKLRGRTHLAVVGHSGGGKSAAQFSSADPAVLWCGEGSSILIDGIDVMDDEKLFWESIGIVQQDVASPTADIVHENIRYDALTGTQLMKKL